MSIVTLPQGAPSTDALSEALASADSSETPSREGNIPGGTAGARSAEQFAEMPASQIFAHGPVVRFHTAGTAFYLHPAFYVTLLATAAILLFAYHFAFGDDFRP